ncbi:MAG: hypothetical protein WCR16_03450, partial [Bacilli bacterium]
MEWFACRLPQIEKVPARLLPEDSGSDSSCRQKYHSTLCTEEKKRGGIAEAEEERSFSLSSTSGRKEIAFSSSVGWIPEKEQSFLQEGNLCGEKVLLFGF